MENQVPLCPAAKAVNTKIRLLREMRACLPDGMWDEVKEILSDLPARDDQEEWTEILSELEQLECFWS